MELSSYTSIPVFFQCQPRWRINLRNPENLAVQNVLQNSVADVQNQYAQHSKWYLRHSYVYATYI